MSVCVSVCVHFDLSYNGLGLLQLSLQHPDWSVWSLKEGNVNAPWERTHCEAEWTCAFSLHRPTPTSQDSMRWESVSSKFQELKWLHSHKKIRVEEAQIPENDIPAQAKLF